MQQITLKDGSGLLQPVEIEQDRLFESEFSDVNISQIAQNLLREVEETDEEPTGKIGFGKVVTHKSSLRNLSKKSTQKSLNMLKNFNQKISCTTDQDSADSEQIFDESQKNV